MTGQGVAPPTCHPRRNDRSRAWAAGVGGGTPTRGLWAGKAFALNGCAMTASPIRWGVVQRVPSRMSGARVKYFPHFRRLTDLLRTEKNWAPLLTTAPWRHLLDQGVAFLFSVLENVTRQITFLWCAMVLADLRRVSAKTINFFENRCFDVTRGVWLGQFPEQRQFHVTEGGYP